MTENMGRVESAPTTATNGAGDGNGRKAADPITTPGNPFGRRLAYNRKLILQAVSDEEVIALVRKLQAMAMEGNVQASKILLQYLAGKPVEVVDPDRVNHDEWELRREQPTTAEVEEQEHAHLPHRLALTLGRTYDVVKQKQFSAGFLGQLARDEAEKRRKEKRREARRQRRAT